METSKTEQATVLPELQKRLLGQANKGHHTHPQEANLEEEASKTNMME